MQQLNDTNFMLPENELNYYYPTNQYQVDYKNRDLQSKDLDEGQPEADSVDDYDQLVGATFLLDPVKCPGNIATNATMICQKMDGQGRPIGKAHSNPLLDTREYIIKLKDGTFDSYFANMTAENLFIQCDLEGREFNVVRYIIDHKTNGHALTWQDGYHSVN